MTENDEHRVSGRSGLLRLLGAQWPSGGDLSGRSDFGLVMDGWCVCVCVCLFKGGVTYHGDILVLDLLEREDVT